MMVLPRALQFIPGLIFFICIYEKIQNHFPFSLISQDVYLNLMIKSKLQILLVYKVLVIIRSLLKINSYKPGVLFVGHRQTA